MGVERIARYEVVQTLGRGAMGVVYLARDPIIDRELAVKTLRVDLDAEYAEEFRERFIREARAAGRLNHNGIVTIHDVGEDAETGLVFIAMEFIRGHDLKEILASGHRFRPSEAARIVADVATALDYAHSMGVIHRDIKPANILLTEDGTAKIMDFGVARLESSNLTVEGQFIGTPNFMSPEQITGKAVDARSDIFSLGVLLYNLLTGHRPFSGETMHEVTMKIVQEPCPIPSTVLAGLPPAFNPIVLKCLEKDPDKRFQTGGDVAKVLAALARSAVQREPTDVVRTAVVSPALSTQVSRPSAAPAGRSISPTTAAIKLPTAKKRKASLGAFLDSLSERVSMPPVLRNEVNLHWVIGLILGWVALWAAIIAILVVIRDTGPFLEPSDGAIANLHNTARTMRAAARLLDEGRLADAEANCQHALSQVPASPAGRLLMAEIRSQMENMRTSEATQQRVEDLVAEGRRRYRTGDYSSAATNFEQALDLDPESEVAASFLELTKERQQPRRTRQTTTRRQPTTTTTTPSRRPTTATTAPRARPTPVGNARITLFFNSPINAGVVTVTNDGEGLAEIPFDFTRKTLGIKRKGTGQVKQILLVPSGRHTIGIELTEEETGSMGTASFTEDLPDGSDWTLRVDLPKKGTEASFYLVRTGR